ncbi:WASH complex subunit 2 isoform X9 [Peromyscus californicus insignis]|uniref:WASH complex subunit 2 isoform X9 n=1 Tax=Peromyscus californicus insignis TaxID=564181 RepID=UPI0022A7D5DD|nr:WASH complex subunit 2 isoform X9 [Peromyscus californicus insignis]
MNGTSPDSERPPASEPVWERPWSVEEIRRSSQNWSLAADAGLLQFLQEFSQQTISRTHEIKKQVDGLIQETKATHCRLHNVFNDFLMLSNTQFIENRVYDEEVEEQALKAEAEKTQQEKTREQKEVDLIPKVREAVNYGLQVLDSAFEQLDIKAGNSDSEEDDANERVELILEPKDLYIDRPLPYLIGSKLFMEQEDVGLGELSSEEGSVGSNRGSIVDSEEEKEEEESDEDFASRSDNDQNQHTTQMSDEEEDDDGDLFVDSEKEGDDIEDIEENAKSKRPTSFADELAARIKGDISNQLKEEQIADGKLQKTMKEKKERRTPPDDEEDSLFPPPKLTDEDFSPFGSRGGLFREGQGLFDDDEDESDLFREASRDRQAQAPVSEESPSPKPGKKIPAGAVSVFLGYTDVSGSTSAPSLKEFQKQEQPTPGKSPHLPTPAGLFDDDDNDDDDSNFFVPSSNKPSKTDKIKSTAIIFDDEEEDLFREKASAPPEASVSQTDEHRDKTITFPSSRNPKLVSETKTQKGLFSDEEDSEDLFSSQNSSKSKSASLLSSQLPTSVSLFGDEDEEDNLFGSAPAKKQVSSLQPHSQEKPKPSEQPKKKASALLFSSDEEDQWNITDSHTKLAPESKSKGELCDSRTIQGQETKAVKKTNLFEEDDDEVDLFAIAKDSQKKTQRASLLFEDEADSGNSLFGFPPASVPPATMKKESISEVPSLFSDEEENEVPSGVKSVDVKVDNAKVSPEVGNADVANVVKKEGLLTASDQEAVGPSDLFFSSSPLDRGTKGRTKTVLSLFDEEDKVEDQSNTCVPQKEMEKGLKTDGRPKSTGVFQDEELLFSHKLQKDNDPDVDLFSGTKKNRLSVPRGGSLFGDDEDDDLFSSAKTQPVVPEKKGLLKKDHPVSLKSEKTPESTQGSKEKSLWKAETPQDSSGLTPFKSREPSSRIGKIQANLAINPAALLPTVALQIPGTKPLSSELAFPSSEPGRSHVPERVPTLPGSEEAGVSFDLPAQADTLHSANKSRVKVRGKRRPQTRAARRLAAQESSESEDMSVSRGPAAQLASSPILPNGHQPHLQPGMASGEISSEKAVAPAVLPWESGPALSAVDRSFFVTSLPQTGNEADLFDSGDIFPQSLGSQSMEGTKVKAAETPAHLSGGSKEKNLVFPVLSEASSADDLFQTVKPRPTKKRSPFPLLEDEDDLFADQKGKKKELKPDSHQDSVSKTQDIFEDDIFATEAVKPFQKKREKERTLEPNLFDDNIDIFADLTVKPKEKSKKKVEAKSVFDDDTGTKLKHEQRYILPMFKADLGRTGIQLHTTYSRGIRKVKVMDNRKEPPFFNEDNVGPFYFKLPFYDTMELFIETLTGTCFELRVSPFEAVISVKGKIQRLEGIPICQQHLIWNNMELEDDYCLNDYNISEGCTLKLVLAMRGGPISTRKVLVEDPLRELAEYMDSSRDEVWEKTSCNKQVTFLVYREGDQLNFFRVVDRGDGTLTPLSESLRMWKSDENLQELVLLPYRSWGLNSGCQAWWKEHFPLKAFFSFSLLPSGSDEPKKVVKLKPRPPVAPRPPSSSTAAARHRLLRVLPHIGQSCLPSPGNAYLPETSRNAGSSPAAAQAPADRPVSSLRNELLKEDDWEINTLSHPTGSIRLLPQMTHIEVENDKELADSVLHLGSSLPRRTKHLSGNLPSNNEDDVLFPPSEECVSEELLLTEVGPFAPFAEGNDVEHSSSGVEGIGKVTPEFPLAKGDRGLRAAEQPLNHVARVLSSDPVDNAILNHRESSSHKNRLLSPLLCAAPVSLHNSLVKPQRQSKCFESGNPSAPTSQNALRELDIRTIADSSFSRTARFRGVKVDSPGKRSDVISKVEARDITEMANKASKEPVGCVNNGFLASLARSASRDSLQSTRGAGRLRPSGIGLSTNFQHFQDENARKSSPQLEPTDFFLLEVNGPK